MQMRFNLKPGQELMKIGNAAFQRGGGYPVASFASSFAWKEPSVNGAGLIQHHFSLSLSLSYFCWNNYIQNSWENSGESPEKSLGKNRQQWRPWKRVSVRNRVRIPRNGTGVKGGGGTNRPRLTIDSRARRKKTTCHLDSRLIDL